MPARMVRINMPSFWMSYVQVSDLDHTVAQARQHPNVIIEVEPEPFDENARVALVRDPSGAGFTLYEGPDLNSDGAAVTRYHHLQDIFLITEFYADLFNWRFALDKREPWPVYSVFSNDGAMIAKVEEVPESVRGTFSYWMPCFAVPSIEQILTVLPRIGATIASDLGEGRLILCDRQGAHFMVS
ncbi:MAG: hypothetical protein HRU30_08660 [Rhodobacteraceae bacterium]|nr:hypothetical protein [Paracoccaceae bacterium]